MEIPERRRVAESKTAGFSSSMPAAKRRLSLARSVLTSVGWPALCLIAAVLFAMLPNFWARLHFGSWFWIADHDGWIYLQVFAHPLAASPYPWLLFGPARLAAHALGWGAARLTLVWNFQAALLTALPLFFLLATLLPETAVSGRRGAPLAAGLALAFIFDTGVMHYLPLVRQIGVVWQLTRPPLPAARATALLRLPYPPLLQQWNILSPALWLGYLFLWLALACRAAARPALARRLVAAAALGLLFYVYFYLWTAALAGLLLLAWLDRYRPSETARPRIWLQIAAGGLLAGLPALLLAWRHRPNPGWLARNGLWVARFRHEPFHPGNLLLYGLSLLWLWRRDRNLLPLWTTSFAAWLLFYFSPWLLGRELQNFHWLYVRNPLLYLLWFLLLARSARRSAWLQRRPLRPALIAVLLAVVASGLFIRYRQASGSRVSRNAMRQWRAWQALPVPRPASLEAGIASSASVAGAPQFVRLAVIRAGWRPLSGDTILLNPQLSSRDWRARAALNLYLLSGPRRSRFHAAIRQWLDREVKIHSELPWTWVPSARQRLIRALESDFLRIRRHPRRWLARYQVRLLGLPNSGLKPDLSASWRLFFTNSQWRIWVYKAS